MPYNASPMWIIGTATAVVIRGAFAALRLAILLVATPFVAAYSILRRIF